MASVSHFAMPFRVENGAVVTVEQDSIEEITQCVEACCHTLIGSRIDAPGYGVPDETFKTQTPNPSPAFYLAAVEEAEPRAHLLGQATLEGLIRRIVLIRSEGPA